MSRDKLEAPLKGQRYYTVPGIDDGYVPAEDYAETDNLVEATVISSAVRTKPNGIKLPESLLRHKVVLDIDLPAQLIPSTTPGHFHLYVDHEIPWEVYSRLLDVMAEAGLIEDGYRGASQARGFTAARLPWVKKRKPAETPAQGPAPVPHVHGYEVAS